MALVVTTLGRIEALERLLDSLVDQLGPDDRLVIVAQRRRAEVEALTARHPLAPSTIVASSAPGAARGRNAGVASLPPAEYMLVFPNDTTWYPAGAISALRQAYELAPFSAGAITVVDEHGPKFSLPAPEVPLDRWNVWAVIEMGLVIRRSLFDRLGGFDGDLGTGAPSPWQAGEATDLLLRLLDQEPEAGLRFRWLPEDAAVGGIADAHGLGGTARRRKLRAYGRGLGRVVARWRYPRWWRSAFVLGGLLFGVRHGRDYSPLDGWWVFLGRLEGTIGRTVGRAGPTTAVTE